MNVMRGRLLSIKRYANKLWRIFGNRNIVASDEGRKSVNQIILNEFKKS